MAILIRNTLKSAKIRDHDLFGYLLKQLTLQYILYNFCLNSAPIFILFDMNILYNAKLMWYNDSAKVLILCSRSMKHCKQASDVYSMCSTAIK